MAHSIKTVYVVHHSHTDIGYTDLQERVIAIQVNYIKTVLSMMRQPEYADFRWNCETLYCVEEFWKQASEEDRADFARFVKEGKIGISANYLNFNDLVNADVFGKRLAKWQDKLQPFGTKIHTAMAADVNGFSMGYRDAMIENGVEFFFTNVHCHHGMYPLYQNQNAFFWENASGQRLLVWNGEHYNLGNVLGLQPNHAVNWMMRNRLGEDADAGTFFSDQLHTNLDKYLTECETEGYPYDFIVTAVSGVFSDNAPPSAEIMETIRAYNEKYGQEVRVEMVSLQELYAAIAPKLTDAPVYRGDWTDWWANTVESADAIRQAISDAEAAIAGRASAEDLKAALDAVRNAVNTAQTKPAAPVQKPADTVKPVQKPADTVKDEHPDIAGGIANGTWGAAPTAKPNDGSAAASGSGATSAIPQTSDNFPYEVLSILACLAVGGFIVALYLKKRSGNR